jgi:adenylosuccinate synthase
MFKGTAYIIYDGQAGSCGKGKFVGLFARKSPIDISINNNPPNAGHTFVFDSGKQVVTTHLPIAVVSPRVKYLVIGASAVINPKTLVDEIWKYRNLIGNRKIYIHKNTAIVLPKHRETELARLRHGSTFKGTAAALCDKIMRNGDGVLAKDFNWTNELEMAWENFNDNKTVENFLNKNDKIVENFLNNNETANNFLNKNNKIENGNASDFNSVNSDINKNSINNTHSNFNIDKGNLDNEKNNLDNGNSLNSDFKNCIQIIDDSFIGSVLLGKNGFTGKENILIETSQGFDLDINHGLDYPYVTSRQCSPAQALADCGIPHNIKTKTYMIFRPYPIRISNDTEIGNIYSGDYNGSPEISWENVEAESLCRNIKKNEMTTVTKQLRRVFELNKERFRTAIALTNPDYIILNFSQYVNYNIAGIDNKKFKAIDQMWRNRKLCAEMSDELYATLAEKHYGINLVNLFCDEIEEEFGKKILFVGTGAEESCFIDRNKQNNTEKRYFHDNFVPGL